jgi:hypothetical protein
LVGPSFSASKSSVPLTMACCKAPVDTDPDSLAASKTIETQIKQDRRDEQNRITLLLLGTFSSEPWLTLTRLFVHVRSAHGPRIRRLLQHNPIVAIPTILILQHRSPQLRYQGRFCSCQFARKFNLALVKIPTYLAPTSTHQPRDRVSHYPSHGMSIVLNPVESVGLTDVFVCVCLLSLKELVTLVSRLS